MDPNPDNALELPAYLGVKQVKAMLGQWRTDAPVRARMYAAGGFKIGNRVVVARADFMAWLEAQGGSRAEADGAPMPAPKPSTPAPARKGDRGRDTASRRARAAPARPPVRHGFWRPD